MTSRRAVAVIALAAAVVSLAPRPVRASGSILTGGATIAVGTGTPQGTVTIDAAAPPAAPPTIAAVPAIGTIGAIDGALPAFGGGGAGAGGAANFPQNMQVAGGVYEFTTYTVGANMAVTYASAVTIRTTGDMTLDGSIATNAANASITIQCGGNLTITSHFAGFTEGVATLGANSPVVIDVNGTITMSSADTSNNLIRSLSGDVTILQHGTGAPMSLTRLDVTSPTTISVFSAGSVSTQTVSLAADVVEVRAFGGDTTSRTSTLFGSSSTRAESSGTTTIVNGGQVRSDGTIDLAAITGDVVIDGTSVTGGAAAATANMTFRAGRHVTLQNAPTVQYTGTGSIVVRAFGGDVSFEPAGLSKNAKLRHLGTGLVDVQASGAVVAAGTSRVESAGGGLLDAAGADVTLRDSCQMLAPTGTLDVRAGHDVTAAGSTPTVQGGTVVVGSPAGAVTLDLGVLNSAAGPVTIAASTSVSLRGTYASAASMRVAALGGGADIAGATVETDDKASAASGAVVVESFDSSAVIDATGSTVKSGAAGSSPSGAVSLLVHGAPLFDGFLLPASVKLRAVAAQPSASTILASGTLDTGTTATDLTGAATLTIGDLAIPVSLVKDARGRYRQTSAGFDFSVVPPKNGSSRAKFALKAIGDFGAIVATAGQGVLALRFAHPQLDAEGRVLLSEGRYSAGKRRGALVSPSLAPSRAKATVAGNTRDALDLALTFATDGTTPVAPPDVTVRFGPTYSVVVPHTAFGVAKHQAFKALKPAAGVLSVTVDYAHETISVKAVGVDLGAISTAPGTPVDIVVSFGSDTRTVRVRLGGKATKTSY
jgi:hypothetical protein